jgi:hypothetical protein
MLAAVALRARQFLGLRPGQGIVSPFTRNGVCSREHLAVNHDTATTPGADYDAEDNARASSRTINSLRERETVGIVRHTHRTPEEPREIIEDGHTVQAGRIRVLEPACFPGERTGGANADCTLPSEVSLCFAHEVDYCAQYGRVIPLRRRRAAAKKLATLFVEGNDFYFCAAQINAQTNCLLRLALYHRLVVRCSQMVHYRGGGINCVMLDGLAQESEPLSTRPGMKCLRGTFSYEGRAARAYGLTIRALLQVLGVQPGEPQALRAVALAVALRKVIPASPANKRAVSPGVTGVASVAAHPAPIDFDFMKSVVDHVPKPAFLADHRLSFLAYKKDMETRAT